MNSALDEDCVGWLEKQRSVNLTLSHVRLTTVDILTRYLFRLCLVFALPCGVLNHEPNTPLVESKGFLIESVLNVYCTLQETTHKAGHSAFLMNICKRDKMLKANETLYSSTFMLLGSLGLDEYRKNIQESCKYVQIIIDT